MGTGARTPEELETLLEDALLLCDDAALAGLFEAGGVLAAGVGPREARGKQEIALLARAIGERDRTYVAAPERVVQARETALVVAEQAINVVRRGNDGTWRYAISLLSLDQTTT